MDEIFLWMNKYNWADSESLPITASEQAAAQEACIAGEGSISLEIEFFATHYLSPNTYLYEHEGAQGEIPCTVNLTPNATSIDNDVCGYVDKRIVVPQQQGITGHEISWEGNIATIAYTAATPYVITGGPFTIEVTGEPCVTDAVPVFSQDEVCGEDNNIIKGDYMAIPEGVFVDTSEVWTDGVFRIWVSPLPGWVLPADTKTEYTFEDTGDCEIEGLTAPIHTEICGENNDTVQLPAEVDHVTITSSGDMSTDGEMTVTFIPDQHYKLPADIDDVYEFTDPGDCMVTPIPPAAPTTVCGPDNDILTIPNQPTGVVIEDSGWMDGERTLELIPAEGYVFPQGTPRFLTSVDKATPCPTDAPAAPVQAEVCGSNNDEIVIPPQPEGVTVDGDSGWVDGTRTITFAVDPAFITEGETEFSFTDENIACPITLHVTLIPSDGASLEDAPWKLFAPVAAQNIGTEPYAEGIVGGDNSIVVEELIAGDYRLVVNADGYEEIDTVLTVNDGEQAEVIRLDVIALQPIETPTPEPTIEPTAEPTIEPTTAPTIAPTSEATPTEVPLDPTQTPTQESANVSGLPSTGSGPGGGFGILALVGSLVVIMLGVVGNRHKLRA